MAGELLGVTVMRTHVNLQVQNFAAIASSVLYGLIVGRAVDVGAAVVNGVTPTVNELDWMLLDMISPTSSAAVVDASRVQMVDNRSKRKMDELNMRYLLSLQNTTGAGITIQVYARTLFALP